MDYVTPAINAGLSKCEKQVYESGQTYYGQFQANSCQFLALLQIFGEALLYRTKVKDAVVYGAIVLRDKSNINNLTLYANRAYVNESHVGNVEIRSFDSQPVIYLNHAMIEGNIVFKGMKGLIFSDRSSGIGKITNGDIQYV